MSVYHRVLRLRHYRPRPLVTALLFEGSIVAAMLLSLAEILEWWSVLVVPVAVAAAVKFNDLVAGLPSRQAPRLPLQARGVARVPVRPK
jgi:hypothetical protein